MSNVPVNGGNKHSKKRGISPDPVSSETAREVPQVTKKAKPGKADRNRPPNRVEKADRIQTSTITTAINGQPQPDEPSPTVPVEKLLAIIQSRLDVQGELEQLQKQLKQQAKLLEDKDRKITEISTKLEKTEALLRTEIQHTSTNPTMSERIKQSTIETAVQQEVHPEAETEQELEKNIQNRIDLQVDVIVRSVMHALEERLNVEPRLLYFQREVERLQGLLKNQEELMDAKTRENAGLAKKLQETQAVLRKGDRINWPLLRKGYGDAVTDLKEAGKMLLAELPETHVSSAENALLRTRLKQWRSRYFKGHRKKIEARINDVHNKIQLDLANEELSRLGRPTFWPTDISEFVYFETWLGTPASSVASIDASDDPSDDGAEIVV
ncbi:hypothetical protein M427DRAFT_262173 [Gonapodya prolifera JEL478]|uniref:Uncharacterized protein n=1 Tax=Gonapodya prolifera (strain JEL478) TaxID=1344416 RepID=A0A138ZXH9_GONPJ|nr:hypothetical protein M427DRAFT_262173 [Gonapodya prolifera JEL478]|eukprot:KXS09005.1 hypothetical protein M427DRAFT_262173 [Gonapodya prolifera JEL478]